MTAFALLSAPERAGFALWALLLCLTDICSAVLAAVKKRYSPVVLAAVLFAPVYLLWQVIFDFSLWGSGPALNGLSAALVRFPCLCWLAALAVLTLAAGLLLGWNLRYDRSHVTPSAIKLFLDGMPCGVCCWRENGRVLFSNVCMNRLCAALTGAPLLNGDDLRDAVRAGIVAAEGRVWRFTCRELTTEGETLHELIASDITDEYARTQALEADRAELAQLNRERRDYYLGVEEAVRRQEILQAKVNIHDEMNRLMLAAATADSGDAGEMDRIFALWEQNALLLRREADGPARGKARERLERLAEVLGLRLVWQGEDPDTLEQPRGELFWTAAQEAVVNAVKHGAAKTLTVTVTETEAGLCCRFSNDGAAPPGPVRLTGGLANLSRLARRLGASVSAETGGAFTLSLCFPKQPGSKEAV